MNSSLDLPDGDLDNPTADTGPPGAPSGITTLRAAIMQGNHNGGSYSITFSSALGISVSTSLPAITQTVTITGPATIVTSVAGMTGLVIDSNSSTIKSLTISGFAFGLIVRGNSNQIGGAVAGEGNSIINSRSGIGVSAILIDDSATGNRIHGNFVGTNSGGAAQLTNGSNGVSVLGSGNFIGGSGSGEGNIIVNNNRFGVFVGSGNGNRVEGNWIGTNPAGDSRPNSLDGILVEDASGTIIGGAGNARNTIRNNQGHAITIKGSGGNEVRENLLSHPAFSGMLDVFIENSSNNLIQEVSSGGAATTEVKIQGISSHHNRVEKNQNIKVTIDDAPDNRIGGVGLGNGLYGVTISNAGAANNRIQGNTVLGRIKIDQGANNTLIGGVSDGERNLIHDYVEIVGAASSDNQIRHNFFGTDASGYVRQGGAGGVIIEGSPRNEIRDNVIAGAGAAAIFIQRPTATGNKVFDNFIGTDASGAVVDPDGIPNSGDEFSNGAGIVIAGASDNIIGGVGANERNVISGNTGNGVVIVRFVEFLDGQLVTYPAQRNRVLGNYIGTDLTGTSKLGNRNYGIFLDYGASDNIIGMPGAGNVVSGNATGIGLLGDETTSRNLIQGNFVGTDRTGNVTNPDGVPNNGDELGNTFDGIFVDSPNNLIGGAAGAGNIIAGNGRAGVMITDNDNRVEGNFIGLAFNRSTVLGNGEDGVYFPYGSPTGNTIGGVAIGAGNVIVGSKRNGINVVAGTGNTFLGNSIHLNDRLGIDLANDGATANDALDADTGPNNKQNFPILTIGAGRSIDVLLNSTKNTHFRIEVFTSTSGRAGEGRTLLGTFDVVTDPLTGQSHVLAPFTAPAGRFITATATRLDDDAKPVETSEFSATVDAGGVPGPEPITLSGQKFDDLNGNGQKDPGEPGLPGWTIQLDVGNDGTIDGRATTDANGNYRFDGLASAAADVNVSQLLGYQAEAAIAVDPANPQRQFVASNTDGNQLFAAFTTDGGVHWQRRILGDGNDGLPRACCDAIAVFDEFGNLFFTYLKTEAPRSVIVVLSIDGGLTFTPLLNIPANDQPTIAAAAGQVWVSFRDARPGISAVGAPVTGLGAVGAFRQFAIAGATGAVNFADLAIGPTGQVMVAYQDNSGGPGPSTIFVTVDPDGINGGQGFMAPTAVPNTFGGAGPTTNVGGFEPLPAQPTRTVDVSVGVAYDRSNSGQRGRAYLVYIDQQVAGSNDTNVYLRSSPDDGITWSNAVRVNDDATNNSQFFPRLSIDPTSACPGCVGVVWYDARLDDGGRGAGDTNGVPNDDVRFFGAVSLDGAATFLPNVAISRGTSRASAIPNTNEFGDYTDLAFTGGNLYPVWADNSNGTGDNPNGFRNQPDVYSARVPVLRSDTYALREALQTGYEQMFPAAPGQHVVAVTAGQSIGDLDFGNFKLPTLAGRKFWDVNGDGVAQENEPGLGGWTIYLNPRDTDNDDVFDAGDAVAVTDASGRFEFLGVAAGNYTVGEQLRTSWTQSLPGALANHVYVLAVLAATSNERHDNLDFGNLPTRSVITGMKYHDINGDGSRQEGEVGLEGWTVFLDLNRDGILNVPDETAYTTVTNARGEYVLIAPSVGAFAIREVPQSGWLQTSPNPTDAIITTVAGQVAADRDFGNFRLGVLTGQVFHQSAQGSRPAGRGLAQWTVFLDLNNDGMDNDNHSVLTDAGGIYRFDGLSPGSYVVRQVVKPGFVQTLPTPTAFYNVAIAASGSVVADLHFGNVDPLPTSGINPLPPTQDSESIALSWYGRPGGTRVPIAFYDIFVSVDGGPFVPFLQTNLTSFVYPGVNGHTYGFYSIATDTAGNVQATPNVAQATVTIQYDPAQVSLDANGVLRLRGTDANDALILAPTKDKLQITFNKKVISKTIPLASIQEIRVIGGGGDDTLTITNLAKPVFVDGGAGTDKLIVTGIAKVVNNFVLNSDSASINGRPVLFNGLENLTVNGQTLADVFTIQSVPTFATTLAGGSGNDTFHVPPTPGGSVLLAGGGGTDTLSALAAANAWLVNNTGAGTLNQLVNFKEIENLTGGAHDDHFKFVSGKKVSGKITAGGGANVLDYSLWTAAAKVDLPKNKASGAGSLSGVFDIVIGGSGADKLTAAATGNILIGNGGKDTLKGGAGRDILFGGSGLDTLDGAGDDDILIGGLTSYINEAAKSADLAALRAIFAEWRRTDTVYELRGVHLLIGTTFLNGPHLLNSTTVTDDAAAKDTLFGRDGLDWFFAFGPDVSSDRITDQEWNQ